MGAVAAPERVRLAELIGALSLAADLGTGQPLEHELGVALAAVELGGRAGCSPAELAEVYYVALLQHIGCTAIASEVASWTGGDEIVFQARAGLLGPAAELTEALRHMVRHLAEDQPGPRRALLVATAMAAGDRRYTRVVALQREAARTLAERIDLPAGVAQALAQSGERYEAAGCPEPRPGTRSRCPSGSSAWRTTWWRSPTRPAWSRWRAPRTPGSGWWPPSPIPRPGSPCRGWRAWRGRSPSSPT